MTVTVSRHFVGELFRGVPQLHRERAGLLRRAGISPGWLEVPHGRVTVEQFATLYRLLVNECDDETPGFFSRPLRGGTLKLLCLSLLEAPTLKVALHRYRLFFLYPGRVLFDCAQTAIYFDRAVLDEPIRQTKQHLGAFLQRAPADWFYVSFEERLLAHRVREHLTRHGAYSAGVAEVAEALHMSVRTLSRHLAAEGTRFQAVKDECRRDFAIQALTRSEQPLTTLAEALGFQDPACFSRAFRSWTGDTPAAYRRANPTYIS